MSALVVIAAGAVVAACLSGVVAAWANAVALMRREHGGAPSPAQILGGAGILLAGMGGASFGLYALLLAMAPRP